MLDRQDHVVRRDVTLGSQQDGLQVIAKGLEPGARVVIDGLQHIKPGTEVSPKVVPMPVPRPDELPQSPPAVIQGSPAAQAASK